MQIEAIQQNANEAFKERYRLLRSLRKQKLELISDIRRCERRGIPNAQKYSLLQELLKELNLEIAKQKQSIRYILPEGIIEESERKLIATSTNVLRSLEIFAGWNIESYGKVSIEELKEMFVDENLSAVRDYQLVKTKLSDPHFSYDSDDFKVLDELVKYVEDYTLPANGEFGWRDMVAEIAAIISSERLGSKRPEEG